MPAIEAYAASSLGVAQRSATFSRSMSAPATKSVSVSVVYASSRDSLTLPAHNRSRLAVVYRVIMLLISLLAVATVDMLCWLACSKRCAPAMRATKGAVLAWARTRPEAELRTGSGTRT